MSGMEQLLERIRGEFREMPGLRLNFAQACRLWQMDPATCENVLRTLVDQKFLAPTTDGAFVAMSRSEMRPAPAKAALLRAARAPVHRAG